MIHLFRMLRDHARRLVGDRTGTVLMLFGLSLIPMTFATGMGIDYARAMRLQTKLAAAADAAALSAVGKFSTDYKAKGQATYLYVAQTAAKQMFMMQTQSLVGSGGLTINYNDPSQLLIAPTISSNGAYVYTVTFNAESTNAFASILGLATLHIKGSASATMVLPTYIDIHVALDTSQSMGLAATLDDAKKLYTATAAAGSRACTFGCHVRASFDPASATPNDQIAKNNSIRLRIDALKTAVSDMVQTASDDQDSKTLYRFALYRIGYAAANEWSSSATPKGVSVYNGIESNLATVKNKVMSLSLGENNAGGIGDTNLADVPSFVSSKITNLNGDGSTQDNARKFFFLVTDGVADLPTPSGCTSGHCTRPLDPTTCQAMKDSGITVAVLYTTYLPIYNDPNNTSAGLQGDYVNLVKRFSAPGYTSPNPSDHSLDIEPALKACASDGWFYKADDEASIHSAMNQLFQQASQSARLTK